jgi:glycosyltransferase involved in cell wall biosynthesis
MMHMHICHIWHNFFPVEKGGVENYILTLSDFLTQQNSDMRFMVLTDKANVPPPLRRQLPKKEQIGSVEVHRLGPNFSSYLRNANYKLTHQTSKRLTAQFSKSLLREAASIPEVAQAEVFHVHGIWRPLYPTLGLQLSQHFRRPLIVSLHGESVSSVDPYAMPLADPEVFAVLEYASVITTYSKQTQRFLCELGLSKKTVLMPNFVDVQSFTRPATAATGSNRAVMVSRLDDYKNPLPLIRAFAEVTQKVPNATLQIVGYGPLAEEAAALIKKLHLEDAVSLTGPKQDVRECLWNSDVFVATKSSYLACLEAWAAGLAVVAPKVGVFEDLISNDYNGVLVDPDGSDWVSSLLRVFNDRRLRETVAENGKRSVQSHDIHVVGKRIGDLYLSLAKPLVQVM